MALLLHVLRSSAVCFRARDQQLDDGETGEISHQDVERDAAAKNRNREHCPERDQEEVEKPAYAGSDDTDEREQTDNSEDECTEEDFLVQRHVRRLDELRLLFHRSRLRRAVHVAHCLALKPRDDCRHALLDAAVEVIFLEARCHHVANDPARVRVGERAFEPVADLDTHAAVLRHDHHQHAVVLAFLAELPLLEHAYRVLFDAVAVQGREGQHRDLVRGSLLMLAQQLGYLLARVGPENLRVVHDTAGEIGHLSPLRCARQGQGQQYCHQRAKHKLHDGPCRWITVSEIPFAASACGRKPWARRTCSRRASPSTSPSFNCPRANCIVTAATTESSSVAPTRSRTPWSATIATWCSNRLTSNRTALRCF